MKITYICNEYPPALHGGIGTSNHAMAHGMVERGHEVTVVGWGDLPGERDDNGVRVVVLPTCRIRFIGWYVKRRRLANWLSLRVSKGLIDIIETVDFEGPLIFRIEEVPVVVRLHLTETAIRRHFGLKIKGMMLRCEKKQLSLYPIWIAVSGYSLELTRQTFGLEPTETKTIYYPIHPPVEKNPEIPPLPPRFVLFAGGRVSRRKGALMLAEAATGFLKKQNDTSLVFVGSLENENGVPIDQSIRNILGPELSRRVSFLGQMSRDQVLAVMRKAAVFAYASTLETFGLVIGEAMLQGCPVVVCEIGPNPEFVEHEKTGLMVPPNDPAAFSNAIERLLENKELAKRLSQAALRQVEERFSLEKSVSESVDFYRSLIQLKTESKG